MVDLVRTKREQILRLARRHGVTAVRVFGSLARGDAGPLSDVPRTGLSLFDLSGKLVWRKTIITNQHNVEIDLPALSAGIYMIKIGEVVKKLVIR